MKSNKELRFCSGTLVVLDNDCIKKNVKPRYSVVHNITSGNMTSLRWIRVHHSIKGIDDSLCLHSTDKCQQQYVKVTLMRWITGFHCSSMIIVQHTLLSCFYCVEMETQYWQQSFANDQTQKKIIISSIFTHTHSQAYIQLKPESCWKGFLIKNN